MFCISLCPNVTYLHSVVCRFIILLLKHLYCNKAVSALFHNDIPAALCFTFGEDGCLLDCRFSVVKYSLFLFNGSVVHAQVVTVLVNIFVSTPGKDLQGVFTKFAGGTRLGRTGYHGDDRTGAERDLELPLPPFLPCLLSPPLPPVPFSQTA